MLVGPITGRELYNKPAFMEAEKRLHECAFNVYNPLREFKDHSHPWDWYLKRTVGEILAGNVDALVLLDGWKDSRGAQIEVAVAKVMGIQTQTYKKICQIETGGGFGG